MDKTNTLKNNFAKDYINRLAKQLGNDYVPLSALGLRAYYLDTLKKRAKELGMVFHKNIWFLPKAQAERLKREYEQ